MCSSLHCTFFISLILCFGNDFTKSYSTYSRTYSNKGWGDCPEHCQCMPLNHRAVRGILDDFDSRRKWGLDDTPADGRRMICQGIRRLPNPVPLDIVTLTILGDNSVNMYYPQPQSDHQSDHPSDHHSLITNTQLRHIDRDSFRGSYRLNEVTLSGNNIGVLYPYSFHHLRKLRHLSLQNNNIRHLSAAVFRGLHHIEEVTLSDNIIEYLPNSVFNSLPNLRSLNLNGNKLRRMHSNQFKSLIHLKRLDLSRNNITGLRLDAFDRNINLEELLLNGNRLWRIEARWFRTLRKLRTLSLRGNNIARIEPGTFSNLANMEELLLSANHIDEIQIDTFKNLRKLKILDLATNDIQEIQPVSFSDLYSLEELYLATNNIIYLQNGTFEMVPRINRLDISRNKIETMEDATLDPLKQVQYLDMSHNKLRLIKNRYFEYLSELKELNLDHNFISEIQKGAFSPKDGFSSKLVVLSLKHNDIRQLDSESLSGIPNLKSIKLGNNKIRRVHSMAFSSCKNLQILDLDRNKLKNLNNGVFIGLPNLIDLKLSNNKLRYISDNSFTGLINLQQLDLEANGIFDISKNAFKSLANLVELNIAGNKLLNFNFSYIDNLDKLYALDISDNHLFWVDSLHNKHLKLSELLMAQNNLQTIRKEILRVLKSSSIIDFTGNPLICDCQVSWMIDDTLSRHVSIAGKSNLLCRAPRKLLGRMFEELKPEELVCGYSDDEMYNKTFACSDVPNTKMSMYNARTDVKSLIGRHITIMDINKVPKTNGFFLNENWAIVPGNAIKDLKQGTSKNVLRIKIGRHKGLRKVLNAIRHPLGALGMQQYNIGLMRIASEHGVTPTCLMAANQFDTISRITSRITVTTRIKTRTASKLKARYGKVRTWCSNSNFLCVKVNGQRKHQMILDGSPLYLGHANDMKVAGIGTSIRGIDKFNTYFIPLWTVIDWVNKVTAAYDEHCPVTGWTKHCNDVSLPTSRELLKTATRIERH